MTDILVEIRRITFIVRSTRRWKVKKLKINKISRHKKFKTFVSGSKYTIFLLFLLNKLTIREINSIKRKPKMCQKVNVHTK